jgi:hypothetical protein
MILGKKAGEIGFAGGQKRCLRGKSLGCNFIGRGGGEASDPAQRECGAVLLGCFAQEEENDEKNHES